ncbi:MAG: glycosyltransferase [Gemmatimonadota bacterium]|nr:glycosyltransferase [Gemmatimonadota bacterium]
MKTILHMIETGGIGGAETVYLELVRALDPTRWRHIAVVPRRGWLYDELTDFGIEPILMPERRSFDVFFFARMAALVHRSNVDLIHAHLFGSAVRAALLARICGVPAIATLHGAIDLKSGERLQTLKVAALNHGLAQMVFVSEQLRQSFLKAVPLRPNLATVVTNGVNPLRFSSNSGAAFRCEYGISPNEFVVGTVANPGPAKGLDVLLETAAILKTRSPGCRFVVVGDISRGRGDTLFKARADAGLNDDVVIAGFRDDVPSALAAFDVYALTSRTEGFPLSLLEAMATSLPVVSTRCGGPEKILDDGVTGLLVENGSPEAIANAIVRLREDVDERVRLGEAAQKTVRERHTLETQVREYEMLYETCLSQFEGRSRVSLEAK